MKFSLAYCLIASSIVIADQDIFQDIDLSSYDSSDSEFCINDVDAISSKTQPSTQEAPANPSQVAPQKTQSSHPFYLAPDKTNNVYFALNYLYWTASEPGLHVAATKNAPVPGQNEQPINSSTGNNANSFYVYGVGEIHKADFDFSSGVRGELAYQFKNTSWILDASYTYFHTSSKSSAYKPEGSYGYLTGLDIEQITSVLAASVNSNLSLKYQNARLLFATNWSPLKDCFFNVSFGPQATWLDQNLNVGFYPIDALTGALYNSYSINQLNAKSWGVGLYGKLGFQAHLGQGFSIGIDAGIAGMSGQISSRDSAYVNYSNNPGNDVYTFDLDGTPSYQFMGQGTLIGTLGYSRTYNHLALRLEASYEFNALINMCDLYRINGRSNYITSGSFPNYQNSNVYLQGLTLKFGIGF